jgi:hypothetical protein
VNKLDELLALFDTHEDQEVKWYKWMDTVVPGKSNKQGVGKLSEGKEHEDKGKVKEKDSKRKTLEPETGTVRELFAALKVEVHMLAFHLFKASWQYKQYQEVKKNMPPGWVAFCMDFSENYALSKGSAGWSLQLQSGDRASNDSQLPLCKW